MGSERLQRRRKPAIVAAVLTLSAWVIAVVALRFGAVVLVPSPLFWAAFANVVVFAWIAFNRWD